MNFADSGNEEIGEMERIREAWEFLAEARKEFEEGRREGNRILMR